ncbi:MAG TPA: PAS domain S-box protein, partial [Xanthomonadales bacterium]|nr:PAS domain S-box protein [Xanthomonadales bacterium]
MDRTLQPPPGHARPASTPSLAAERETARGLRATIDLAPVGIAHFGLDGRFLLVNDRMCAILGYAREELLARTFQEITFPEDLAGCIAQTARVAGGEIASYQQEKRFVHRDGTTVWTRVTVSAVRDDDGAVAFFVGVCEDVSEHQRLAAAQREAQAAAEAREAKFRSLANTIPQMVWIAASDGSRSWYNDRWYEYTGSTPEEMLGHGWHRVHHPDHFERVRDSQLAAFARGEAWDDTFPLRGADGAFRWFLSRAVPIRDASGAITHWFGTNTDVTERRQAEQAVRESEARLRRIVDSGIVGVFYARGDGTVTDANDALLRMLRYERGELQQGLLDWRTLTHESSQTIELACLPAAAGSIGVPPREAAFYASDGRIVQVLLAAAPLETEPDHCVAVCVDISRRKEAELERERLFVLERDSRLEAERATRTRDEMIAIAAHDLRNPLHTIAMSTALLLKFDLPAEARLRQLAIVQRTAQSMDRLLGDFLDVSRIEAGGFTVVHEPVELARLLSDTAEEFAPIAREAGIALSIEPAPRGAWVLGDHDRLKQVLSNLIGNAVKFTPAGGAVSVTTKPAGTSVQVSVADTGPGIDPAHVALLFERYWQAERNSRRGAG